MTYRVRWRTAEVGTQGNAGHVAAGSWQDAAGDDNNGEDVGAVLKYTIEDLVAGTAYDVSVAATNSAGASSFTSPVQATPTEAVDPELSVFLKSDTSTEVTSLTKAGSYTFTVKGARWTSDVVGDLGVLLTACLVPAGDAELSLFTDCDSDGLATLIGITARTGSQGLTTMYGTASAALQALMLISRSWPTFAVASDGTFTQDMAIAVPAGGTIITAVTGPFDAAKLLQGDVDLTHTVKHTVAVDSIAGLSAATTTSSARLTWTNASFCTSTAPACSYWVRHKKSADADSEWSSWANTGWTSGAPAHTVSSLDENTEYDFELQRREGTGNAQVTVNEGSVTASTKASNRKPTFDDGTSTTRSVAENSPMVTNVGSPVAASDSDSGDTLTYSMTGDTTNFTIDTSTGQIKTSASLNHEADDSYTVTVEVTDSKNAAGATDTDTDDTITVTINVTDVNEAPTATNDAKTINEDSGKTEINVIANDTDPENDTLAAVIATNPTKGTAALKSGSTTVIEYTPNADAFGKDSFTYKASDGTLQSTAATVTITITGINDKPVAVNDSKTINEDSGKVEIDVTANDTDADNDDLTASIVTNPQKGTAAVKTGDAGVIEYTPNANANGSDSFTYKVNDGTVDSTAATVSITINAVNDAPVAVDDTKTINEDSGKTEVNVIANDTDVEGDTLSVTAITTAPSKGTAAIKSGSSTVIEYTPKADAFGKDSLVYTVSDGSATGSGTLKITITGINDKPVAVADSKTINEDSGKVEIDVTANDTDADNDTLTASIATNPQKGTAAVKTGDAGVIEYTPNANANGSDSFTYKVNDGTVDSDTVTVSITINAVNDAPVGVADSKTIDEDSAKVEVNVIANDTDVEGDTLSVTAITTAPSKGTAAIKTNSTTVIEYTPNANANGEDRIVYTVSDGTDTGSGTLTITINPVNDDPVFSEGATATRSITLAGAAASSAVGAALGVTHPDTGDTLTFGIGGTDGSRFTVSNTGQISVGSSNLPVDSQQSYTVTVTVRDSKDSSGEADTDTDDTITVTINITGSNRKPTFDDGTSTTRSVAENSAAVVNVGSPVAATDADTDQLTYTMTGTDASSFTIAGTTGQIKTKTSLDRETKSSYSVTVKVTDSKNAAGNTDTTIDDEISVTINVTNVNEGPTAVNDSKTINEDSGKVEIAVTSNDTDPENDSLTASIVTSPNKGTAALKTGSSTVIEYTPNANANGSDSFTYKVSDGTLESSAATVSITINAVNDDPVAVNDAKTIVEDSGKTEVNVITNDTDIDSTTLSVSAITTAPHQGHRHDQGDQQQGDRVHPQRQRQRRRQDRVHGVRRVGGHRQRHLDDHDHRGERRPGVQ